MIGSSTQTWLGESYQRDHLLQRLPESVMLPGFYSFGDHRCRIIRFAHDDVDEETGEVTYRSGFDYYFDDAGVMIGRDRYAWGHREKNDGEFWIVQRQVFDWTFHDEEPEELGAFRAFLLDGLENPDTVVEPAVPIRGAKAPDVTLTILDGSITTLSAELENGPVLLDFWATWCPPCRKIMPIVKEIAAEHRERGVQVIAVAIYDEEQRVRDFLAEHAPALRAVFDGERTIAEAFHVRSVPQLVLIDRHGIIRAIHYGASDDLAMTLRQQIGELD
jgi:thiol-disulfide isomerase/thioredoxin